MLDAGAEVTRCRRTLGLHVSKMSALGRDRPLVLKSPGYTVQIGAYRALWPDAQFVHIYRNPYVVFEPRRRALRAVRRERALTSHEHVPIDELVLEVYPRVRAGTVALDAERSNLIDRRSRSAGGTSA